MSNYRKYIEGFDLELKFEAIDGDFSVLQDAFIPKPVTPADLGSSPPAHDDVRVIRLPVDFRPQKHAFEIQYSNADTWRFFGYIASIDMVSRAYSSPTEVQLTIQVASDVEHVPWGGFENTSSAVKPVTPRCRYCGSDLVSETAIRCLRCAGPTPLFWIEIREHIEKILHLKPGTVR